MLPVDGALVEAGSEMGQLGLILHISTWDVGDPSSNIGCCTKFLSCNFVSIDICSLLLEIFPSPVPIKIPKANNLCTENFTLCGLF